MKIIVITGSTRGIGLGLARSFLALDCRVVVSGRSEEAVAALVASLGEEFGGGRVVGAACDITSQADLVKLWQVAVDAFGGVDVWINNAGVSLPRLPLWEQAPEALRQLADINLGGMLLANRVVLAGMVEQGHGQIWNMEGFGSGGQTQPGMCAYGASKRAVNYLNRALQKEVRGTGVQVNTLSPGIVVTDLLVGDYDTSSPQWEKSKRIFNILGDSVETVTPWLARKVLASTRSGDTVAWLTGPKAFWRFLTAGFNKRDLFAGMGI
ncbi:SDR family oxidoreductase [Parahaliea maris]|uniref:SDR family oxidoreductase n=1 Tax=Parahaliea maris TaxID=2716870 RepID=A0A5C9AAS1_9GAMM|nr:SDR family NAD(P)-dependent oxidoreductase [Parahaliea maris]TXS96411.1 SDR family oxidoreductase [Parahaliea maris]